jgi:hypothetical protein
MHVLSGKVHWQVRIGFCSLGPFCYWSRARKNASISLADRWKSQFLDQEQDKYNISWRVGACVHGKEYVECEWWMGIWNAITSKREDRGE